MPMIDESAHDPATVAYDQQLVPWLFDHWAEPFLDLAEPLESARVLDLACGSGLITRHLLGRLGDDGRIEAVDFDAGMVAYASSTTTDGRVGWHVSDATDLPFAVDSLDAVLCHQGLQFFPDRPAAVAEIARTVRPGGRLVVGAWGDLADNPWAEALVAATRAVLGDEPADGMATVSALADPARLASLLRGAGFVVDSIDVHERAASHPDALAAVAGQVRALPGATFRAEVADEQRDAVASSMTLLLAPHVDLDGGLSVPSTNVFAVATLPG